MVLYKIISLKTLVDKPVYIFLVSAFFVLFGFLTAFFIFPSQFSIAMVSFSSLMILPYVIKIIESEEFAKKVGEKGILNIFKRHDKIIVVFVFMFLGMVVEYTMLFAFVPTWITDVAFENQLTVIFGEAVKSGGVAGTFFDPMRLDFFLQILINNLAIVVIAFLLSLFYGLGAIFILNYNASIAAIIYGTPIRTLIWAAPNQIFGNVFLYLPHTILEILGFLLAAVAGSIIMKSEVAETPPEGFVKDSMVILMAAVALIFIAAFVEVTVPFIFV